MIDIKKFQNTIGEYIKTIDGIPLKDEEVRNKVNEIIELLDDLRDEIKDEIKNKIENINIKITELQEIIDNLDFKFTIELNNIKNELESYVTEDELNKRLDGISIDVITEAEYNDFMERD
jgi:predicted RNA-binding protein Jag